MISVSRTGAWHGHSVNDYGHSSTLALWLIERLKGQCQESVPVWDLGCGVGLYGRMLVDAGFTAVTGVEGEPIQGSLINVIKLDLTVPFLLSSPGNVIFTEVGEHVPAQFQDVLIDNVCNACSNELIMSWAVRGQGGTGHVNCLDNDEVIDLFSRRGMVLDSLGTTSARNCIDHECPWLSDTLLIMRKCQTV